MMTGVPYLPEKQIERDAAALLAEFEQARSVQIDTPVPIEGIIEKHLARIPRMDCTGRTESRGNADQTANSLLSPVGSVRIRLLDPA